MNRFDISNPIFQKDIKFIEDYNKITESNLTFDESNLTLAGNFKFSATFQSIIKWYSYDIKIIFSEDYPNSIPKAINVNNRIIKQYSHFLSDNSLCLGVPTDIYLKLQNNDSIKFFLLNILVHYYFSYDEWEKTKTVIFRERSHGVKGIIEYYYELLEIRNFNALIRLLRFSNDIESSYNQTCPCNSGKSFQSCHMPKMIVLNSSPYFSIEYENILHFLREQLQNSINSILQQNKQQNANKKS
ncbi:MAG TPA: SEC-C domain-containing protein [Candidatus Cloacimonadota bacterium]|nr:SEC-C domain-containing protein [Candidatus Cloacimonadota bacterium]